VLPSADPLGQVWKPRGWSCNEGQTARRASDFYHRFFDQLGSAWANLARLANNNVTVTGPTTVKWVRPVSVTVNSVH
jgi:hypothetical protein